jgi:hypothetical protein
VLFLTTFGPQGVWESGREQEQDADLGIFSMDVLEKRVLKILKGLRIRRMNFLENVSLSH